MPTFKELHDEFTELLQDLSALTEARENITRYLVSDIRLESVIALDNDIKKVNQRIKEIEGTNFAAEKAIPTVNCEFQPIPDDIKIGDVVGLRSYTNWTGVVTSIISNNIIEARWSHPADPHTYQGRYYTSNLYLIKRWDPQVGDKVKIKVGENKGVIGEVITIDNSYCLPYVLRIEGHAYNIVYSLDELEPVF